MRVFSITGNSYGSTPTPNENPNIENSSEGPSQAEAAEKNANELEARAADNRKDARKAQKKAQTYSILQSIFDPLGLNKGGKSSIENLNQRGSESQSLAEDQSTEAREWRATAAQYREDENLARLESGNGYY